MTYEHAIQRLEAITNALSTDTSPLSEAIPLYEEALECHRAASEQLTAIEARVKQLCATPDGSLSTRDL